MGTLCSTCRLTVVILMISLACMNAQAERLTQIREAGKIRIAMINGLPNFSQNDPRQGWTGSDAETARLLAADLQVKAEFIQVANSERISSLLAEKVDIIVSALSVTPEREQIIAFSIPYSAIALVIGASPQAHINSYRDLAGKRIGVGRNTSDGAMLKQRISDARFVEYPDETTLLNGFLSQQFDIISCQRASLALLNKQLSARMQVEEKFIQREFQVAIGMRKEDAALRNWINTWVGNNLSNGRLNDIFRRHHGQSLPDSVLPTLSESTRVRS